MILFPPKMTKQTRHVLVGLGLLLLLVLLRTAWVGDDAYITFRVVDNVIHGYGPVWNVVERVQAYTHPLWMWLMAALAFITRDVFYTSIFLSIVLTLATATVLAVKISRSPFAAIAGVALLIVSKAFVDYSTSGLENPLAHLLVAIFFWVYLDPERDKPSLFWPAFWASLVMLTRFDLGALLLPPLAYLYFRRPSWKAFGTLVLGLLPLVIWHLWSTWYYGFPFPNTGYAKLNTGISADPMVRQGVAYLENLLRRSPNSAMTILWTVIAVIWVRDKKYLAAVAGLILYGLYLVRIGGDFMTGRLLSVPFLVAVILVCRYSLDRVRWAVLVPVMTIIALGVVYPRSPLWAGSSFGVGEETEDWDRGVSDERAGYFQYTGLFSQRAGHSAPNHPWQQRGLQLRAAGDTVVVASGIGMLGYFAGPSVYIVDQHALTDPLLARLPAADPNKWRIGHFERRIPVGYVETLKSDTNRIKDPSLAAFYDTLTLVTRGDLWSSERLRAIGRMNCGTYHYLLSRFLERPERVVGYAEASRPKATGMAYDCDDCFVLTPTGMTVQLDSMVHAKLVETSTDNNDNYEFIFLRRDIVIGRLVKPSHWIAQGGLVIDSINIPESIRKPGYDVIEIVPRDGDGQYGVGHIRILEP